MSSEAALAAMLAASGEPWPWLIAIASLGNVLGSLTNWAIGRGLSATREHPRFPIDRARLDRAEAWYRRWGYWSLLLSWVPIIGDPLTIAAGFLREPFWIVLALVSVAKIGRYLVVAAAVAKWL